jgi:DNA-binding CsgD family transcriptional regulator/tetratricopeptide (TPR) repeat protein
MELLERAWARSELRAAVTDAAAGRGSVVLVSGEAGIGKSSLVRELCAELAGQIRIMVGACDDLLTARALGPLRDAAAGTGGPLEAALLERSGDAVFDAAIVELSSPTLLLVEDVHWADDATLDVLGYLARRVEGLPTVVVVTVRDGADEPLHRWYGSLAGAPVRRLVLRPLSLAAVETLAVGTGWEPGVLHSLTGGNPFFVTEALAGAPGEVPATVADAVVTRVRRLSDHAQQAVAQLSVVPGTVDLDLAEALLGTRLHALGEAEERGILREAPDGVAFRHELARRAIEQSLPVLRRRLLHRAVITALRRQARPDLARLVHHAAQAGDAATVIEYAARAGRESVAAGSHRQALAHFEVAAQHADRLPPAERAAVLDDYAWELHNAHRFAEALRAGEQAVALYRAVDNPVARGEAGVRLSRLLYLAGDTDRAQTVARQAVEVLEPTGSVSATAYAMTYHGAALALGGDKKASGVLRRARELAARASRVDLQELVLNYQSLAEPGLRPDARIELLHESLDLALAHGHHEHAARAYTNLAESLYRHGRFTALRQCVTDGLSFTHDRGFWSHAYNLDVHRSLLSLRTGDWAAAESQLRSLVGTDEDTGMLRGYAEPHFGRLLARRGAANAGDLLATAWKYALRQRSLVALAYAGTALMEWAWLADRPETAAAVLDQWRPHAKRPGAEPVWAELLRYAARAGLAVPRFPGCPSPWASGLAGDWATAAAGWERLGDPYERALELAGSNEVDPTLEALRILDDLGATAAAHLVRRRLKALGMRTIPRGPLATTRAHPAGLTTRQADVLHLLVDGLTNAEIAAKLVLSVRTVDHHVSSILGKLGVSSRREATVVARQLATA